MTDNTTPEVPAGLEQLDMSLTADANVNVSNLDSLTRDQLIRINGINAVLGLTQRSGGILFLDELLRDAEIAADYIRNGVRA